MPWIKIKLALLFILLINGSLKSQNLVINELSSSNLTVIEDDEGEYVDWIELYNSGSDPLSLEGYGLSDDTLSPLRWSLPDTILIEPKGILIDQVLCGVDSPWPNLSGKEGLTIALLDPEPDNTLASSWSISGELGGTPGKPNWKQQLSLEQSVQMAQMHQLGQNYPNPFSAQTSIYCSIGTDTRAKIEVYNLSGQLVTNLVDQFHSPGHYSCSWDGTNSSGGEVSEGIYLYRISTDNHNDTMRMILMK